MRAEQAVLCLESESLHRAGMRGYSDSRLAQTIEDLGRARQLASAAGRQDMEDLNRFWEGAALHGAGRLHQALAVWAPALSRGPETPLTTSRYMALTRFLLVAIDVPVSVGSIRSALERTEARLRSASGGLHGRRSRLLLARARLALARGRPEEALPLAQESVTYRRTETGTYTYSTHYRTLVQAALLVGELDLVEECLHDWERVQEGYRETRTLLMNAARADLARGRGQWVRAIEFAEAGARVAARSEETLYRQVAQRAYVQACLAAGQPERAAETLVAMLRGRHGPMGEHRYEAKLLLGDYHATVVRLADPARREAAAARGVTLDGPAEERADGGGGPARQLLLDLDGARPVSMERHVRRARRAYRLALEEARFLDGLLDCDHRQREVEERLRPAAGESSA